MNLNQQLTDVGDRYANLSTDATPRHAVNTRPGHFTRMSLSPLLEWHSFATIGVPGVPGYSAIISRAGDWTSARIDDPPKELWVRGVPCYGVVHVAPLFRRVVLVATGSGIAPLAPVVYAKEIPIQLLWTAPAVRKTFGDKLVDSLLDANPNAVIYGALVLYRLRNQLTKCPVRRY